MNLGNVLCRTRSVLYHNWEMTYGKLTRGLSIVLPYVRYGCPGEETQCGPGDGYWGQCEAPPHHPIPHTELTLHTIYRLEHFKMSISGP